ncbi:BON domain-containing protein [Pseudohongiella sp.]|uniref:BON domain-containing protein n=1 Tax=marine sediment metagenome TaxID=412755 RepID=A0A0F9W480_9ZZZZ|nr:BON domain-containing protein [Pseudohongiella sp.]HDZ10246.1 BON domain-containing protein [Pseudohongiella sp.]HEA64226.1 BON domain-containing protein [Pseudohongiella sp.]
MKLKTTLIAIITGLVIISGTVSCSVARDQQTVGAYIDDATITTQVKARMLSDSDVSGTSISVETLDGTVMPSGFATSATEKATAGSIARGVNGVTEVRNEIVVRR